MKHNVLTIAWMNWDQGDFGAEPFGLDSEALVWFREQIESVEQSHRYLDIDFSGVYAALDNGDLEGAADEYSNLRIDISDMPEFSFIDRVVDF